MDNCGIINILSVIMIVVAIICILKGLFTLLANNYIKRNREQLFNDIGTLSQYCKELGNEILENENRFYEYIDNMGLNRKYHCSNQIVSNAANNKVKYLIKYSDIEVDIDYLEQLDFCISFFNDVEEFNENINQLYDEIYIRIPIWVRRNATANKVPFIVCDIDCNIKIIMPTFCFVYISPAGNSKRECKIRINGDLLSEISAEIVAKLNKSGHAKTQRSAMTNDLREAIKKRDNYTCCLCGNSVYDEPNLLLEVDHVVPISRGGKTEVSNLQTLCWRCNRAKSNR